MPNVLVIDDEPLFREGLELNLELLGHVVRSAETATEAFAMIIDATPDIVVSDILMPTSDGIEVLREIKKRWPQLPVIVMSGGGKVDADDLLTWARDFGAEAAFSKPFEIRGLSDTISAIVAGRKS